jgi:hypothetical protein
MSSRLLRSRKRSRSSNGGLLLCEAARTLASSANYMAPIIGILVQTLPAECGSHTWKATACHRMNIGHKGLLMAAKSIASLGCALFTDPEVLELAKADLRNRKGTMFTSCQVDCLAWLWPFGIGQSCPEKAQGTPLHPPEIDRTFVCDKDPSRLHRHG